MAATLAFDISTAKGTVRLTSGKLFRGGEYRLALTLDGTAVTDEVAMVRIYGDVRSDTRGDEICVAEATASDDGYVVKTDTEAIERLFTIHAGAEIIPVRVVVYVTEAIVADGRTMLYWSPTMAIVDGKPIDTRGEKGDDGYTPVRGKDYFDGKDGEPGPKGDDGYTPVKGVDYFDGKDGEDGNDGEGAYQAAVRGGYAGDEATFIADLSKVSSAREEAERAEEAAEICEELLQSCGDAAAAVDESVATLNQDVTRISSLQADVNQAIATAVDAKENAVYYAEEAKGWWDSAEEAAIYADDAMQRAESARDRAETAKGDAVKAQGEASKSAEQASTSASNASKSAEQAEQAKTAIGDVGGRLDAVETSVTEKVPYLSEDFHRRFKVEGYTIANKGFAIENPCHKGWICRLNLNKTSRDYDLYVSPNGTVTKTSVALFPNSEHGYKLHIVYTDKTLIFSENYRGEKIKCTITDSGVTCETLTAFPANVASYTGVFGIINSHGFIVTTGGVILKGDTLEEVEGVTFYVIKNTANGFTKRGDCLIYKDGEKFYYYDATQRKFCTLTTDANGTPTIAPNTYTQNANYKYTPIGKNLCFLETNGGFFNGISADNGNVYGKRTRLEGGIQGAFARINTIVPTKIQEVILFDANGIYRATGGTGGSTLLRIGENIFYKWMLNRNYSLEEHSNFAVSKDYQGNTIVACFHRYTWESESQFYILTDK